MFVQELSRKVFIELLYKVLFSHLCYTLLSINKHSAILKPGLCKSWKATQILFINDSQRPYCAPAHMPDSCCDLVVCGLRSHPWIMRSASPPCGKRGRRHEYFHQQSAGSSVIKRVWGQAQRLVLHRVCQGLATSQMCTSSKATGTACL